MNKETELTSKSSALSLPLDNKRISSRKENWGQVSYLQTWDVIATANRIFGFFGWNYTIVSLKNVWEGEVERKQGRSSHDVHYTAQVRLEIQDVIREDIGYGNGMSYNSPGESPELAVKEAVSDALKRCFRTFGEQFGNTLYDKNRDSNGADTPAEVDSTLGI